MKAFSVFIQSLFFLKISYIWFNMKCSWTFFTLHVRVIFFIHSTSPRDVYKTILCTFVWNRKCFNKRWKISRYLCLSKVITLCLWPLASLFFFFYLHRAAKSDIAYTFPHNCRHLYLGKCSLLSYHIKFCDVYFGVPSIILNGKMIVR